ncbi:hypothetical protein N008_20040 [Hymenobacter sp. APR13]|nr:hypothetical protein N008_20040 [Hymenobacter sp. APR13]
MDTPLQTPTPEKRKRVGSARGGRKEIPIEERRVKRIVLRFTEEEYAELKHNASKSGRQLAVMVRSQFQDLVQLKKPWTAEQFRLCRELATLSSAMEALARQANQEGLTSLGAEALEAARKVSRYLDTCIA